MSSNTPNTTLYINNLNDSINKEELRAQLYALFLPYGTILDVVALKTAKMRGQAFVVFADLAAATTAMRSWDGESFYDKPMVSYQPPLAIRIPRAHMDFTAHRVCKDKIMGHVETRRPGLYPAKTRRTWREIYREASARR
jgi:hypothetical protein